MRYALISALALATLSGPALAAMSPAECTELAAAVDKTSSNMATMTERLRSRNMASMLKGASPEIRQRAEMAQSSQVELAAALREYVSKLEDLSYQLKLCGRQ